MIRSIRNTIAALVLPSFAFAQTSPKYLFPDDALGLVHNAYIEVIDDVTGGCWTNSNSIKQKARLTLEQSGISVYDEPLATRFPISANVLITAHGKRSSSSTCFGTIEVKVADTASRFLGDIALVGDVHYFESGYIAIGPSLNNQFLEAAESSVNELAADILSGRRNETVEALIDEYGDTLKGKPWIHRITAALWITQ
ncbi:hypothetical protein HXW73_09015 [Halomonas sp. SH5A2]|uniref:hypothetical protein n=1 Tax=Halomonas sp. SH5A2 TaxID=2749040 RepID=UPI001640AC06|nr:hypothetical protein [Halomonas sp. SH5A2]QNI03060.1 hypothetical protein HXW73_09015 [Halomonas sp. SH5A2]